MFSESVAVEPSPVSNPRALELFTSAANETPYLLHSLVREIQEFDCRALLRRDRKLTATLQARTVDRVATSANEHTSDSLSPF
jgi:hypothetical protein